MNEEVNEEINALTPENIGKGLAFLGVVLFVAYGFFFWLSITMPQLFNLFSGPGHFIGISIICLVLIIGGYALTKMQEEKNDEGIEV